MIIGPGSPHLPIQFASGNPAQQANNGASDTAPDKSVTITIKASDVNVSEGDRSNNSAQVSLSTPTKELQAEVTREQTARVIGIRSLNKALGQVVNTSNPVQPSVARAIGASADADDLLAIASSLNQTKLANTYLAVKQNGTPGVQASGVPPQTIGIDSPASGTDLYNQAVDSRIRQTLVFSVFV